MRVSFALTAALITACGSWTGGCSSPRSRNADGGSDIGVAQIQRNLACPPARSAESIPFMRQGTGARRRLTFTTLVQEIDSKCARCHRDTTTGGYRYADAYSTGDAARPGVADSALLMLGMMTRTDEKKMPSEDTDPEGSMLLADTLQAWIDAGKPQDTFLGPTPVSRPEEGGPDGGVGGYVNGTIASGMTNLGDCVPRADMIAQDVDPDVAMDELFARATSLPADLRETDLTTLDTYELAKKRIFAFAPTYQLWADNARKIRMVRVPKGERITFNAETRKFGIPPNTRFYKTFYKRVLSVGGQTQWRRIETRLIVSRADKDGQPQALFGTYRWNDEQTQATLWQGPYRNGAPFEDVTFQYLAGYENCQKDPQTQKVLTDPETGSPLCDQVQHTYAIPGKDRCIQCHQGSEGGNFVLGFTPLQVNRRPLGAGGVYEDVGPDELNQLQRLIDYGVVAPFDPAQAHLEDSAGTRRPRNVYELQAQAYMVGNCAHCHNPNGFPTRDNPGLRQFNLAPGGLMFQFPILGEAGYIAPLSGGSAPYVAAAATDLNVPGASLIYRRVATPVSSVWTDPANSSSSLVVQHMPANTPGVDCRAPQIVGRWIASIPTNKGDPTDPAVAQAMSAANVKVESFNSGCVAPPDVENWVPEDLTDAKVYVPRRSDWNSWTHADDVIDRQLHPELIHGMPRELRDVVVDEGLKALATTPVPYGYWAWKPECKFPDALPSSAADGGAPGGLARPWMFVDETMRQPVRPLGEVYMTTPGAAIFKTVCSRCHGIHADGNSGNAKALYALSGGTIRVANLVRGLFGPQEDAANPPGSNLPLFDVPNASGESIGPFGAARYLTWMASGGTNVKFPDGFDALLGSGDAKFGGNMLTKVNYICSQLLPQASLRKQPKDPEFDLGIPEKERELWSSFCTYNNPIPANVAAFDSDAWLRRAQFNGGVMVYFFFRDLASHGIFPPGPTECEQVYPGSVVSN